VAATVGAVLVVAGAAAASNNQGQNNNNQGQNGRPSCTVTATSGCLTFTNVVLPSNLGDGSTVTVNGVWSFTTTCNDADPTNLCPATVPNNLAAGSGTYVIKDSTGAVVERGTIRAADTAGSIEGLDAVFYTDLSGNPTSCSAAAVRGVGVFGSTGNSADPSVEVTAVFGPAFISGAELLTSTGLKFPGSLTGVTISC
jgi:hypothetical protein